MKLIDVYRSINQIQKRTKILGWKQTNGQAEMKSRIKTLHGQPIRGKFWQQLSKRLFYIGSSCYFDKLERYGFGVSQCYVDRGTQSQLTWR